MRWLVQAPVRKDISTNDWPEGSATLRATKICATQWEAWRCFDDKYYQWHNKDLPRSWKRTELYNHFLSYGQFEARKYR